MQPNIFFLGNGPLADAALHTLEPHFHILFHAHQKADLEKLITLKKQHPEVPAILASFGVIIKKDLLDLFDSTGGIINIHPSLLPKYRGPSPIESAILDGEQNFGVSIMKLGAKMDAGPIYYQTEINGQDLSKAELYNQLATIGAEWLVNNLFSLPHPVPQDDTQATFCQKLTKDMSRLDPSKPAAVLLNEIRALAGWPKSKYDFFGQKDCIIHAAHISKTKDSPLSIKCEDGNYLIIDRIQPPGRKVMDSTSFLNGYGKNL